MRSALKASDANVESRAGLDSNSLWIIERDNAAVGGPCKWDDSFRLLHLNSGNFLSTVEGGRAGKVRVVCQTQIRANAALFRLKKLKNNLPNGVKGKPHLIFRNQPFLVCTDLTTANKSKIPSSATTRAESSDATVAANSTKPDAEDELSDADRPDLLDQQLRRRWLSSEDEPAFGDKKSGTGVGEPFRQVSFAVHAIRTQRIQVRTALLSAAIETPQFIDMHVSFMRWVAFNKLSREQLCTHSPRVHRTPWNFKRLMCRRFMMRTEVF